jgi:hypothetical protein
METGDEDTRIPLREYIEALDTERDRRYRELSEERDRRYTEIGMERERALKIKETGDRDALELARAIQTYKDEKANELREQITRERGLYVTQPELRSAIDRIDVLIKPISDYITGVQHVSEAKHTDTAQVYQLITLVLLAAGVIYSLVHH